jgi:hypothetical protein
MLRPTFLTFDYYIGVSVNNFIWVSCTAGIVALSAYVSINFTEFKFFFTGGLISIISGLSFVFLGRNNQEEIVE